METVVESGVAQHFGVANTAFAEFGVASGKSTAEEVINTSFCPLQEKFHTFVLLGLRNISEAP
jgi:hypothetical protein